MNGPGGIEAGEVTKVDSFACRLSAVLVNSPEEAIAAVHIANGIDILSRKEATLGGYTGTRFDLRVRDGLAACHDGRLPLVDGMAPFVPGMVSRLYLLDVEGTTLAVALQGRELWGPDARAAADEVLASLQIERSAPAESAAPTANADPTCIQFDGPGSYTAPAGQLSLSVDVPGTSDEPWIGERDHFGLLRAACSDGQGSGKIEAGEVTRVHDDACEGENVDSLDQAIAAVSDSSGINVVARSDGTFGGHPGTRFDI